MAKGFIMRHSMSKCYNGCMAGNLRLVPGGALLLVAGLVGGGALLLVARRALVLVLSPTK